LSSDLSEEEEAKVTAVLEHWKENEKFRYYKPNRPGEEFLRIIGSGETNLAIFSAANGVGKTTLIANLLANLVWGSQSHYFDQPLFKSWPYPKRARWVTDPKLVEEIGPIQTAIKEYWPKGHYEAIKAGKSYYSQYTANDWILDIMSLDQDPSAYEGSTLGLVVFDEPPTREIFNACVSRLRLGGLILIVMTPLVHAAWVFDELAPRHSEHIVYATMEDACKEHGVNGHLEHKNIEKMIAEMPPDEVEARVYGKAMYLSGVIFKQFDKNVHVLKEPIKAESNATLYQSVDPHSDKPFACIWGFPDRQGNLYIVDEWPNTDFTQMHNCQLTIQDYAKIFKDKEGNVPVSKRIIDRHFADVRSAVNKKTLREELRDDVGLDYYPSYQASEEIETGILSVRSYLQYDTDKPLTNLNKPKLYINPHCFNTIKAFQRWARDARTGKVKDDHKDFMDCVRYLVMDNPEVSEPIPYTPAKKMWGGDAIFTTDQQQVKEA
jgi:hypothetical protein